MLNIRSYGSSSEDEGDNESEVVKQHSNENLLTHLKPVDPSLSVAKTMQVCAAPVVMPTVSILSFISRLNCVSNIVNKSIKIPIVLALNHQSKLKNLALAERNTI